MSEQPTEHSSRTVHQFPRPDVKRHLPTISAAAFLSALVILSVPSWRRFLADTIAFTLDGLHPRTDTQYFFERGVLYTERNRTELAIRTFGRVLESINPADPYQRESLYNVGVLHYQSGQSHLQRMTSGSPRRRRHHERLMRNRFEKAKEFWAAYLRLYPGPAERLQAIAEALSFIDGLDERSVSEEARRWKDLGQRAYYRNDYDEALRHYFKAITLDPDYATVYNNIGALYYFKRDYTNAVRYWTRAVELDPVENRDLFLTIGAVYYEHIKDPVQAVRFLKEHLRRNPKDPQRSQVQKLIRDLEAGAAATP